MPEHRLILKSALIAFGLCAFSSYLVSCGDSEPEASCSDSTATLALPLSVEAQSQARVDNIYVADTYTNAASTPAGSAHLGIHLSPQNGTAEIEYLAAANGTVTRIEERLSAGTHNINVLFETDSGLTLVYQFETQASADSALVAQRAKLNVTEGQSLREGEAVGTLHDEDGTSTSINPIFHLGVIDCQGELVCPSNHFRDSALNALNALLAADQPTWNLCYGD